VDHDVVVEVLASVAVLSFMVQLLPLKNTSNLISLFDCQEIHLLKNLFYSLLRKID
jgi:hypothetical protein